MDSSRRRKCVFTDRPLIWRQKTLDIDEFSNTNRVMRSQFPDLESRNASRVMPVTQASCFMFISGLHARVGS